MKDLSGKVAVVTGGASGIGRAMANRFAAEGMQVMLADVETDALSQTEKELRETFGADAVASRVTDVRQAEELEALAELTYEHFGAAHVICNNAGVGMAGLAWDIADDRWRWIVDVNLLGVVNGVRAFTPRLIEQGEGHIVNTASAAGIVTGPFLSPYYATKHAVVAMTEALYLDLQIAQASVGVSVLCPEWVKTSITESERNRPDGVSASPFGEEGGTGAGKSLVDSGIEPAEVAEKVLEAITVDRFWILTHPTTLGSARKRWNAIEADDRPVPWKLGADED